MVRKTSEGGAASTYEQLIFNRVDFCYNRAMLNLETSLILLKVIAHKFQENEFPKDEKDKYIQVIILFFNRLIIDISAISKLIESGYHGSTRTLLAVTMRNLRMFASLVDADEGRIFKFWNEDETTYQTDESFSKLFGENPTKKLAQKKFGDDAFNLIELEKSLHGSCYALRKFYTDRITINGQRTPVVRFDTFKNKSYEETSYLLADGFVLDFLGVFFTKFKNLEYLKNEFDQYLILASYAKNNTDDLARKSSH